MSEGPKESSRALAFKGAAGPPVTGFTRVAKAIPARANQLSEGSDTEEAEYQAVGVERRRPALRA